ncbi:MAG: DUF4340 domain-containing protein [Spirochaetaceae bacterium]|jgi:hypothetical protein|nr:DUF4340 domain-containing protein [Spirochaetaceae bacterium]
MTYKDKLRALLFVTGALVLLLAVSYVFDPEQSAARNSLYTWLDKKYIDQIDRIELGSPDAADSEITLLYREGRWQAVLSGENFPAREERVGDLLALLSRRAGYPVRAASEASRERLGVSEERAGHIRLYGGANSTPLLELLVGGTDALGSDVYLRKKNDSEIRSGERSFSSYAGSRRQSWYDLRLRLGYGTDDAAPGVDQVQRVEIRYAPGSGKDPVVLARESGRWTVNGREAGTPVADAYIRTLINAEADDFVPSLRPSDPFFNQGTITMELDDGGRCGLSLGPGLPDGKRAVAVADSPYVYALAEWTVGRLFRDGEEFLLDS